MGLLDHRKTWTFTVRAPADNCFRAFHQAMVNPGFKLLAIHWRVERGSVSPEPGDSPWPASIAIYEGRAGVGKAMTIILGQRAEDAEQGAMGSQVTFAINPKSPKGQSECLMWLSKAGSVLGFINDADWIRSYMRVVEKHLRALDPTLTVDRA